MVDIGIEWKPKLNNIIEEITKETPESTLGI